MHERVAKLEASGVITGYRAVVDPPTVGLDVTALIGVIESDSVDDVGVEEAMRAMPEVEDCWRVAGSEGYVLKVRVTDIPALEATIGALNRIRGVARTRHDCCALDQVGGPSWLTQHPQAPVGPTGGPATPPQGPARGWSCTPSAGWGSARCSR